jgi:hypothetical protein
MKRFFPFGIAIAACACALIVGCAKIPQQEINNAQNALESAKTAKAPMFAEEQFKTAQALVDSALADIRAQNTKSPFSHNYDKAKKMLLQSAATSEAAIAAVPPNKAKVFEEAKALFDKTKAMIDESNKWIEEPLQKKNKVAIVLKMKLTAAAASLPEDITKVPDESLLMMRSGLRVTMTALESIKASVEKLNPSKKIVMPLPVKEKEGKGKAGKKKHGKK